MGRGWVGGRVRGRTRQTGRDRDRDKEEDVRERDVEWRRASSRDQTNSAISKFFFNSFTKSKRVQQKEGVRRWVTHLPLLNFSSILPNLVE
jgi:hypothetical protein